MTKVIVFVLIFFLILSTSLIKNSTKNLDDQIYFRFHTKRIYHYFSFIFPVIFNSLMINVLSIISKVFNSERVL